LLLKVIKRVFHRESNELEKEFYEYLKQVQLSFIPYIMTGFSIVILIYIFSDQYIRKIPVVSYPRIFPLLFSVIMLILYKIRSFPRNALYYLYLFWAFSILLMIFIIALLTYDNDQLFKTAIIAIMVVVFCASMAILDGARALIPMYIIPLLLFCAYISVFKAVDQRLVEYLNVVAVMIGCSISAEVMKKTRKKEFSLSKELNREKKFTEELLNKEKAANRLIESEISFARKIQEQLIPFKNPSPNFAALYKPMRKVGGDFYDYIAFRNSSKTGIFLSDVSGHGVPAAFITSMIKATILQSGERKSNPAELLMYINDLLLNQTGGNFITAFYAVYDPSSREVVYSNAGHHPPLSIKGDTIDIIHETGKPPLAVFSNEHLKSHGKEYSTHRVIIPEKSKLLFYTDGLVETRPEGSNEFFEHSAFESFIRENSHLVCSDFIDSLWLELCSFRKSDNFEDDICVICLDVD